MPLHSSPFICDTQCRAFYLDSHSFHFHRRRTRPHTWSVPTPFIVHNLTFTQTTSRLPTPTSGSTDARMVCICCWIGSSTCSRLNVSRYCFSQLDSRIHLLLAQRTVQYHTWPFGSPIYQHTVVMTSLDIPHIFTTTLWKTSLPIRLVTTLRPE